MFDFHHYSFAIEWSHYSVCEFERRVSVGANLAVACDSPAEVDEVYHQLVATGVEPVREPWDAFWGQRYARVLDPDGNTVDLYAPLPGA